MIREVILPQLAMGMSEGTVIEWLVPEGGRATKEEALIIIETEKVTTELPSPHTGYLHHVCRQGDAVPVETPMAIIADTEEEYRQVMAGSAAAPPHVATPAATVPGADFAAVATPPPPASLPAGRIVASGLAKALARKHGLDLTTVKGSGPRGRVVKRDVLPLLAAPKASLPVAARSAAAATTGGMRERARIPLSGMRAVIAERMLAAKTSAAHTYTFFEVDVTKLQAARQTMLEREAALQGRVSLLAFYLRAVAIACAHVPICNATLEGREITAWANVNIGVAVALPGKGEFDSGLVVPVVRDVDSKGLLQIDREVKEAVKKARAGRLAATDMAEGTITVSSTGGFVPGAWGVSTPLLNLPQVVNVQPGTPIAKPVVVDGQIVVRSMLPFGLSFDHRAMDGEPIGRFVAKLSELLGHPELMLL